jgi:hypothetical protein
MRLLAGILLLIGFSGFAQPEWLDHNHRDSVYNSKDYVVGFSSRYYETGEDVNEVLNEVKYLSRIDLSESIFVSVRSESLLEVNTNESSTSTSFEKTSVTRSSLDAYGLKTESHLDSENQVGYAFSYVKKKQLQAGYYKLLDKNMKMVKNQIDEAMIMDNLEVRYNMLSRVLSKLHEVAGLQDMLMALGITNDMILQRSSWKNINFTAREEIRKIRSAEGHTLTQALQFLIDDMYNELKGKEIKFSVGVDTFKNTGNPTEFSSYLQQQVRSNASAQFNVLTQIDSKYRLNGTYWPSENGVRVTMSLHEYQGEEPLIFLFGGAFQVQPMELTSLNLAYEVDEERLNIEKHFNLISRNAENGGMEARVLTQKGGKSVVFREGEPLELTINVSRPSFVRLINVWADGTHLSVLDNYYIDESQVNKDYKLPFNWNIACPCGTEYLKLITQSEPFAPLTIRRSDGLDYVQEDLEEIILKTRNYQDQSVLNNQFYYAEDAITLTTLNQ